MTITKYKDLSKFEKDNLSDWTTKVVKLNFDDEDPDKFGLTELGKFINTKLADLEDEDKIRIGYPDGSTGDFYIPIKLIKGEFKKLLENHVGHKLDLFSNNKLGIDKNTRKLFAELKKTCNTKAKRIAYNKLISTFANDVFVIKDNFIRLLNSLKSDDKIENKINTIKNPKTILEIALAYLQLYPEGTLTTEWFIDKANSVGANKEMISAFEDASIKIKDSKLGKYGKLIRYINEADEIYKTLDVFNPEEYIKKYYEILKRMSLRVGTYSEDWHKAIKSAAREIGYEVAEKLNLDSDEKLRLSVSLADGGNWNTNEISYSGDGWSVIIRYKYDITQGKLVPDPKFKISWSGNEASQVQKQIDLGTLILDELTDAFKRYGILDAVIIALSGGADRSDRYKVTLYSEWTKMLQEVTGENLFIYGDKLGGWGSMSSGKGNFTVLPMIRRDVGSEKSQFLPDAYFKEIVDRLNGFKKGMAKYVKSSLNSHYGFQYISLDADKFLELYKEFKNK